MANNNEHTYIGITIGPIGRIISYTRSTKSLWGASYFFSYIGKKMITELFEKKRTFLKPLLSKEMWDLKDGVGRFPDQYIFQSEKGDFEYLIERRESLLNELAVQMTSTVKAFYRKFQNVDEQDVVIYLKHTVKIYILGLTCEEGKAVELCQQRLALMECQDIYPDKESVNYLALYFEAVSYDTTLIEDAFGEKLASEKNDNRLFPTIIEMAGAVDDKLLQKKELNDSGKISSLQSRYKYIAFVSADGDNTGKALKQLGKNISSKMLVFNKTIARLLKEHDGQLIYNGGDDLLFVAPVYNIFEIIKAVDDEFNKQFAQDEELKTMLSQQKLATPTMSFGVSLSYYKYPMSESLALAEHLLGKAKEEGKDRIKWNLRKHSGQSVKSTMTKPQLHFATDCLIKDCKSENFLHSVGHYLYEHIDVIAHILENTDIDTIGTQLENYMDSTFMDESHQDHTGLLQSIREYIIAESRGLDDKSKTEEAVRRTTALLRYIELIIHKPQKEQTNEIPCNS